MFSLSDIKQKGINYMILIKLLIEGEKYREIKHKEKGKNDSNLTSVSHI